jgi:hypothetical protein
MEKGLIAFEKYLENKQAYLLDMITVFRGSKNPNNETRLNEFFLELNLVEDIIYHFDLFVKGREENE